MKRVISFILTVCLLSALVPMIVQAGDIPVREIDGETYYVVSDKKHFYNAVKLAFSQLEEHLPVCYIEGERNWDRSYSNDSRNFTGIQTDSIFTYAGYSPNTVCITENYSKTLEDGSVLCYGTIDVEYSDSREELAKADAIIDGVLAKTASYSQVDRMLYIADYICAATEYGAQELPGGGYDLINGVYELLTGVRTNIVCTSYALTFQRFMEKANIPCYLLSNNYHAWNIVQVDGAWYGVDCTQDAGKSIERSAFLMGKSSMRRYPTDRLDPVGDFSKDHTISEDDYGKAMSATTTKKVSATSESSQTTVTSETYTTPAATTVPADVQITVVDTQELVDLSSYFDEDCDSVTITGENFAWRFETADMETTASALLNVSITLGEEVEEQAQQAAQQAAKAVVEDRKIYPFTFAHHGALPGKAAITIKVDDEFLGKTVDIYSVDENGAAHLEDTASVDADGRLTFTTTHCSVWFVAEQVVSATAPAGMSVWIWFTIAAVVIAAAVTVWFVLKRRAAK